MAQIQEVKKIIDKKIKFFETEHPSLKLMKSKTYLEFREWFEKSEFIGKGIELYLLSAWNQAKLKYTKK